MTRPCWGVLVLLVACSGDKETGQTPVGTPQTGAGDTADARDSDGDGHPDVADCGPADPTVYPGAPEVCNRIDDDCDGIADNDPTDPIAVFGDLDGDGYGDAGAERAACTAASGEATRAGDCDDSDAAVHPAATELCWSGKDEDCDGDPGFCGPSGTLTTAALTERWWGTSGDRFGTSVAWSADPTGSGDTVLLVGAPGASTEAGGLAVLPTPLADGGEVLPDLIGSAIDQLGASVQPVGDVTADGFPDVLVGAPGAEGGRGAVHLFLGSADGLSSGTATLTGLQAGDRVGHALSVGDTDGDAKLDLAIGIPDDIASGRRGSVVVVPGPLGTLAGTTAGAATRIWGTVPSGRTGQSVAFDGDVNGDGLADLAVGAPREGAGRFAIFLGPVSGTTTLDDADHHYESDGTAYDLGQGVAWLGDTDSDGTDDLAVSAPAGSLDGAVLVFYGTDIAASDAQLGSGAVGAAVLGTGYSAGGVARVGDVNGDGRPDVHAGGPGVHWSPLSGGIDAEDADLWLTAELTETGRDVPGWLPAKVGPGALPDLDGDGYAELIFAGPGLAPSGRTSAGEVQVLSPAGF